MDLTLLGQTTTKHLRLKPVLCVDLTHNANFQLSRFYTILIWREGAVSQSESSILTVHDARMALHTHSIKTTLTNISKHDILNIISIYPVDVIIHSVFKWFVYLKRIHSQFFNSQVPTCTLQKLWLAVIIPPAHKDIPNSL